MKIAAVLVALLGLVLLARADEAAMGDAILAGLHSGNWNYEQFGLDWDAAAAVCKTGPRQSPINIITKKAKKSPAVDSSRELTFKYSAASKCQAFNSGHGFQVGARTGVTNGCKMGTVTKNGVEYEVLQFHVHTLSEHMIDGKKFPLELHIVHRKVGSTGLNDLLVVGIMFREGKCSEFLKSIEWNNINGKSHGKHAKKHQKKHKKQKKELEEEDVDEDLFIEVAGHGKLPKPIKLKTVDLSLLEKTLVKGGKYYNYPGSLTTPPCTESVDWHVLATAETACSKQIHALSSAYPVYGNARFINAIGARKVLIGEANPLDHAEADQAAQEEEPDG